MTAAAIGARIRAERRRLGISQGAFAALGGMTKGAQAKWESAQSAHSAVTLAAWHEVGADVLYIVTGRRDPVIAAEGPLAAPPPPPPLTIADALAAIAAQAAPARVRLVIEPTDEAGA